MSLIIEIVEGHHLPDSRNVADKVYWSQKAYMHNGGPFPAEVKISIPESQHAKPVGKYELLPSAYQAGKFGDLELNRFDLHKNLKPIMVKK